MKEFCDKCGKRLNATTGGFNCEHCLSSYDIHGKIIKGVHMTSTIYIERSKPSINRIGTWK